MKGILVTEKAATTVATTISFIIATTTNAIITNVTMEDTQEKCSFMVRKRVKIIDFEKNLNKKANITQ